MADEKDDKHESKRAGWYRMVTGKKIGLIFLGIVVAVAGFGLMAADGNITESPNNVTTTDAQQHAQAALPENARGLISGEQIDEAKTQIADAGRSFLDRIGPWLIGAGISFAVGVVVGIMFRTFIKTAAALTAFAVIALIALTYFGVLSGDDVAGLKDHLGNTVEAAKDEVGAAKSWALRALPNAIVGFIGFIFGFLRK
ncbi:MAG: FUN14 domain-containing protein [Planctomycetota bacterium]